MNLLLCPRHFSIPVSKRDSAENRFFSLAWALSLLLVLSPPPLSSAVEVPTDQTILRETNALLPRKNSQSLLALARANEEFERILAEASSKRYATGQSPRQIAFYFEKQLSALPNPLPGDSEEFQRLRSLKIRRLRALLGIEPLAEVEGIEIFSSSDSDSFRRIKQGEITFFEITLRNNGRNPVLIRRVFPVGVHYGEDAVLSFRPYGSIEFDPERNLFRHNTLDQRLAGWPIEHGLLLPGDTLSVTIRFLLSHSGFQSIEVGIEYLRIDPRRLSTSLYIPESNLDPTVKEYRPAGKKVRNLRTGKELILGEFVEQPKTSVAQIPIFVPPRKEGSLLPPDFIAAYYWKTISGWLVEEEDGVHLISPSANTHWYRLEFPAVVAAADQASRNGTIKILIEKRLQKRLSGWPIRGWRRMEMGYSGFLDERWLLDLFELIENERLLLQPVENFVSGKFFSLKMMDF